MTVAIYHKKHFALINWAEGFINNINSKKYSPDYLLTSKFIKEQFLNELKNYFALCGLARSQSADQSLTQKADSLLFRTRVKIEKDIINFVEKYQISDADKIIKLLKNPFFGTSSKQGVSLRMPLSTCMPTKLCASGCYAHDVLDAAPNAIIRGAFNGWLAQKYENSNLSYQELILETLEKHVMQAVKLAQKELSNLPHGYSRRPFIRFSHVGEIVYYPDFSNMLAEKVRSISKRGVDCVVYTRHKNVSKLDPKLWIINFTLDPVSLERRQWAPDNARIVFSAFGGEVSPLADVNFLEHHRHSHMEKTAGSGRICPATLPAAKDRTCDGCKCNRCFVSPS